MFCKTYLLTKPVCELYAGDSSKKRSVRPSVYTAVTRYTCHDDDDDDDDD